MGNNKPFRGEPANLQPNCAAAKQKKKGPAHNTLQETSRPEPAREVPHDRKEQPFAQCCNLKYYIENFTFSLPILDNYDHHL